VRHEHLQTLNGHSLLPTSVPLLAVASASPDMPGAVPLWQVEGTGSQEQGGWSAQGKRGQRPSSSLRHSCRQTVIMLSSWREGIEAVDGGSGVVIGQLPRCGRRYAGFAVPTLLLTCPSVVQQARRRP